MKGLTKFWLLHTKTCVTGEKLIKLKHTPFTHNHTGTLPFMLIDKLQMQQYLK